MEENKPLESDSEETLENDFDELFEEQESNDSPPESKEGEKDVQPTDQLLSTLKEVAGREFDSLEDFKKHYSNLKSYVGKKVEPEQKTSPTDSTLTEILKNQQKIEFFMETPDAKEHFNDFVKPLAEGSGISYQEAWMKVQPMIQVSKEKEQEKIGVDSKTRIKPINNPELKKLEELARTGNPSAQEEYIRKKYAKVI